MISTVAGSGEPTSTGNGGPARRATHAQPYSLLLDAAGISRLARPGRTGSYTFSGAGNRYRVITPDGRIAAFAGTGEVGYTGDGGPATKALLKAYDGGMGIAVHADGRVYLTDGGNHAVRVVDADGMISTFVVAPG